MCDRERKNNLLNLGAIIPIRIVLQGLREIIGGRNSRRAAVD